MVKPYKQDIFILRIIAASLVIVSHAYQIYGSFHFVDPLGAFTNTSVTIGNIGVYIFFVISGFLLSKSIRTDGLPGVYVLKRIIRIFPALITITGVTILVGGWLSQHSFITYFESYNTFKYLDNITLYFATPTIPSIVFNRGGNLLNASLWTLPFEFSDYLLLVVINWFAQRSNSSRPFVFTAILSSCVLVCTTILAPYSLGYKAGLVWVIMMMLRLTCLFTIGAVCERYQQQIRNGYKMLPYCILGSIALFVMWHDSFTVTMFTILIFVLCLSIPILTSNRGWRVNLVRFGDPTYGMYLSGWFVTQILCQFEHNLLILILTAWVVSLIYGYCSWYMVERRPIAWMVNRRSSDT